MRHLAALAAALCIYAASAGAQALGPAAFRDAVIAQVRALEPRASINVRGDLAFEIESGVEVAVNLANAYAEYGRRTAEQVRLVDYYARAALAPLGARSMRQQLVLVVRPRAAIEEMAAHERARGRDGALLWRNFAGDLAEILALEDRGAVEFVSAHRLSSLGIGIEEAWRLAPANTAARLGAPVGEPVEPGSPVLIARGGNGLAPSALAVRDRCMEGGPAAVIALVIDRGEVLFADLDAPGSEARFLAVARAVIAEGLSASQTPIACRNGVWEARAF